jgi:hypothetical protein
VEEMNEILGPAVRKIRLQRDKKKKEEARCLKIQSNRKSI